MIPGCRGGMARTALIAATCALAFASGALAEDTSAARSVWDGIYTDAQAERGAALYAEHCVACHQENFGGAPGTPPLIGPAFTYLWDGETVGALYEIVRTTMPSGQAGLLSDQEYLDVLTTVLQANGFPAAESGDELPPDPAVLDAILFQHER